MKVGELKKGMLLAPAGDSETFLVSSISDARVKYVCVRARRRHHPKVKCVTRAMYLGDRKDLNMTKKDNSFSNRYVLIDGEVAAVDPPSWIRIKSVINESR